MKTLAILLLFGMLACTHAPNVVPDQIKIGKWGRQQFEMNVSDTFISFTWGCAGGHIDKALRLLDKGSTRLSGSYKFIGGAQPANPDMAPKEIAVVYHIKIIGDTAYVQVLKKDSQEEIGSFEAVYAKESAIVYCY